MTVLHSAVERALAGILSELGLGALPARLVPCPRPELGDGYQRIPPVAPQTPVVPADAPGALRLPIVGVS